MDPFSALGIAAAIVQFVDFGHGLLRGNRDAKGVTHPSFESVTKDLDLYVADFGKETAQPSASSNDDIAQHELALRKLAGECKDVAQKLLATLHSLKPKARQAKWVSCYKALSKTWKEDDLVKLKEQLELYRNEMVIRLLAYLNAKMDMSMDRQGRQLNDFERHNQEIISVITQNHEEMLQATLTTRNGDSKTIRTSRSLGDRSPAFTTNSVLAFKAPTAREGPAAVLSEFATVRDMVLNCLHFRQIIDRFGSVKEAHKKTFQWIFRDPKEYNKPWYNFPHWLERETGCYWIQGKAGSGKSTLMKLIYQNVQTTNYLNQWASPHPLTVANFFFWYLGTPLQKSQEGLLRSLLHDIIRENPRMITDIMPELCVEATKLKPGECLQEASLIELNRWFGKLSNVCSEDGDLRICLFVDGLDEYIGDHSELIRMFLDMASSTTTIKFVLSSRPITECVYAFSGFPSLRLQDLTLEDMKTFATDLLKGHHGFLRANEQDALVNEIVSKSSGVFLWVSLVVRSLLEGLISGDTSEELKERLDGMPSELESLYRHMIKRIPSIYQRQASEMLQVVATNVVGRQATKAKGFIYPLPALQLSFALSKPSDAIGPSTFSMSTQDHDDRINQIEARIRSRCLGFLELRYYDNVLVNSPVVELIHRTALEFLNDDEVLTTLRSLTEGTPFDPYISLFCSTIWMIKIAKDKPLGPLRDALIIAGSVERHGNSIPNQYLKELDKCLRSHERRLDAPGHWFGALLKAVPDAPSIPRFLAGSPSDYPRTPQDWIRNNPFPAAPIDSNLHEELQKQLEHLGIFYMALIAPLPTFLKHIVTKGNSSAQLDQIIFTRLLAFTVLRLWFLSYPVLELDYISQSTAMVVALLLDAGADPNELACHNYSIWELFLCSLCLVLKPDKELDKSQCAALESMIRKFIAHGADLQARFVNGDKVYTPMSMLQHCRRESDSSVHISLEGLISHFEERQGTHGTGKILHNIKRLIKLR